MTESEWIAFYAAARDIHQRIGGSLAEAQMKLRRACRDGLIRTMKALYEDERQLPFEFWARIAPHEWSEREVDYDGLDADGCKVMAMIHEDDFRQWLNKQQPTMADASSPPGSLLDKRATRAKRELVRRIIADLYPGGIPGLVTNPEIAKQVQERLPAYCKENNLPRRQISDDTILRAAGRKQ